VNESWASSDAARRTMQANRSRDTKAELAVRRLVHAQGLRYRVNARPEPSLARTADLLFATPRVAVFLDGCFWHGCPQHSTIPRANREYWASKLQRNRERDLDTTQRLEERGWVVLRFWEHEAPSAVADQIGQVVRSRRERLRTEISSPAWPRPPGS